MTFQALQEWWEYHPTADAMAKNTGSRVCQRHKIEDLGQHTGRKERKASQRQAKQNETLKEVLGTGALLILADRSIALFRSPVS